MHRRRSPTPAGRGNLGAPVDTSAATAPSPRVDETAPNDWIHWIIGFAVGGAAYVVFVRFLNEYVDAEAALLR